MFLCSCFRRRGEGSSLTERILTPDENDNINGAVRGGTVERENEMASMSSSLGSFPSIPISYNDLKHAVRQGLMPDARLYYWPVFDLNCVLKSPFDCLSVIFNL